MGLIVNNENYLQGQILLLLSQCLGKGAVETRRAAQPSNIPLSFVFCLQALRSLWRASEQHLMWSKAGMLAEKGAGDGLS